MGKMCLESRETMHFRAGTVCVWEAPVLLVLRELLSGFSMKCTRNDSKYYILL